MLLLLARWDHLSHASLLESITSLLRKGKKSRVYMVSGLHTGRSKIVSFLRRCHRHGLQLVTFPSSPSLEWPPNLSLSEIDVQAREQAAFSNDGALRQASELVVEMQVLTDVSEEATQDDGQTRNGTRTWQARTARLNDVRRTFVVEEREEEKMENEGVHVRNRWMTFLALGWQQK